MLTSSQAEANRVRMRERYRNDPVYRQYARDKTRATNKKRWRKYRTAIFDKLGHKCVRCGFDDVRALQFDHIYGGGRKLHAGQSSIQKLQWILEHLDQIQVLCANCNWIKRVEEDEQPPGPPRRFISGEAEGSETTS